MKIKIKGVETTFKLDEFEFSLSKKELKRIAKRNRTDGDFDLIRENEELRKRLNDAHSQLGDMRKQLDAMRRDMHR